MITKAQMMDPMLTAFPSFVSVWNEFLNEWKDEKELPPTDILLPYWKTYKIQMWLVRVCPTN